jgi:hypothetical protein
MTLGDSCPICLFRPASVQPSPTGGDWIDINCQRCGDFALGGTAHALIEHWHAGENPERKPRGRFAASHVISRMQGPGRPRPKLRDEELRNAWLSSLPNPPRMAELLIQLLGDADQPMGAYVVKPPNRFSALIGTEDDPISNKNTAFNLIVGRLAEKGWVQREQHRTDGVAYRLTLDGWAEYERLKSANPDSRTLFMAMKFNDAELNGVVESCFKRAAERAGFVLKPLAESQPAGLIDDQMRNAIRVARLTIADLTHANRGAHWEAGFAEGLGRPVIYTCREDVWRHLDPEIRPHFDTSHLATVIWTLSDLAKAERELLAMIRATLPGEAKLED